MLEYTIKLTFFLISFSLSAQNQVWHFGEQAGIDFNTSPPTNITTGQMIAQEGCSSISDNRGNLLFYSDGVRVWNRNHTIMPNGNGLMGNLSTTMSCLIVPKPGDTTQYYVFTLDELVGSAGMRYSIVDMTLNGGLGDVSTKNVSFHSSMTEKMVGLRLCNGNVWIISHQWNSKNFYADLLTPSGFNPTVTSSVGTTHSGGAQGVVNAVGHMAISQQGDRLAIAMRDGNIFEVFDFDESTGVVSNPITLNSSNYYRSYGVEFSPDGTKLYGASLSWGEVWQFDLTLGNASAIMGAAVKVGNVSSLIGAIKAAPDGRIYVTRAIGQTNGLSYLATIGSPNLSGTACNFMDNSFSLGSRKSLLSLPNTFIDLKTGTGTATISGDSIICFGDSTTLSIQGSSSVQWIQGFSAATNTISVKPTSTTTYKAIADCGDTLSITVRVDSLSNPKITASDTLICPGDSVVLSVTGASGGIQWGGGGLNSTQTQVTVFPSATTSYYVTGGGSSRCSGSDTVEIVLAASNLLANFFSRASPCGLIMDFECTNLGADSYVWDFGDGNTGTGRKVTHTYASSGIYPFTLTVTNSKCNQTSTINTVVSVPDTAVPPKIEIPDNVGCQNGTIHFNALNKEVRYQYSWDFGNGQKSNEDNPTITFTDTGRFEIQLTVADTLCGKIYNDSAIVNLKQLQSEVFIPNCFTPNGDGINELFEVSGSECGDDDVLEIYNRWGSRLYRTENPYDEFWDGTFKGKQCTESVYYYLLFTNNKVYKGHLSLVR